VRMYVIITDHNSFDLGIMLTEISRLCHDMSPDIMCLLIV